MVASASKLRFQDGLAIAVACAHGSLRRKLIARDGAPSRATSVASVYVALKHLFPDIPANSGVMEPISITIAPASLLDAQRPRPVGGYTETILRIIDVLFSAFARIRPDAACGNAYGTINALSITGHRSGGARWVMFSFFGGGHGANAQGDGLSHGNPPIATAIIPPVEIMEAAYPILYRQWPLRPGSGGPGAHRGGLGAIHPARRRRPIPLHRLHPRLRQPGQRTGRPRRRPIRLAQPLRRHQQRHRRSMTTAPETQDGMHEAAVELAVLSWFELIGSTAMRSGWSVRPSLSRKSSWLQVPSGRAARAARIWVAARARSSSRASATRGAP